MIDPDITRLSRLVALLTLLQTKRILTATELSKHFSVSTRTIYRDIRTLESAGIPVVTLDGKGYTMMDGYRLPPVMFTRDEAIAMLTAEKLAARLTDVHTANLTGAAMNKLRAAMRYSDRDHLETLAPQIQVMEKTGPDDQPNTYRQLVTAVSAHHVVHISYRGADSGLFTDREIEPIGLYLSQNWHVVAYCRLRQAFRDFRLDRIQHLTLNNEIFTARHETLQQYWDEEGRRRNREKVIIHFNAESVMPAMAQHMQDTKHQYGWTKDVLRSDGSIEMTFFIGSIPYLANWLLPFAGAVTIVEPDKLRNQLSAFARRVYEHFC